MTTNTTLKTILENYKAETKRVTEIVQNQLAEVYGELLNKLPPEITGLSWNQYTPYFNDGEACEFRVGDMCFTLDETLVEAEEDLDAFGVRIGGDFSEEGDGQYHFFDYRKKTMMTPEKDVIQEIDSIHRSIPDEIHLGMFDDHTTIRLSRGSTTFAVEEFDHE